ncbi:MAG TPA: Stp1/IreP family PP2C-type Ser/Thr phosphatase [Thermoleophilaceae bacterium]|nr:Stp1/IreP family PP2C-type Ser/Thr phosphatase [Thermoleophilaceae bacterium]
MLRIADHASKSDVGRQRHTNEDNFYDEPPLFAVADGMGGAQAGEVASEMAISEFVRGRDTDAAAERQLEQIAQAANRKIWDMAQADSRHAGMGTTLTAAMLDGRHVAVGHVGDSRLYLYRDGELERMTRDHSLVEEFVRQGKLTPEQAERHPQRSVITRALGPENSVEVDTFRIPARDGDLYLICSDGLSGMVSDDDMAAILAADGPLDTIASDLVDAANDNGGRDNITAVLFRLEDDHGGDPRTKLPTESYETIAGDEQAPTAEQIEAERRRISEMDTQARIAPQTEPHGTPATDPVQTGVASAVHTPPRASPRMRPPPAGSTSRPRPAARRRGRWLPRAIVAGVLIVAIAIGAVVLVSRNVYFVGTNDEGLLTLYRGLPYDLPLGVRLYTPRYVSGVPALSVPAGRRSRVLDHQLRSRADAADLIRSLDRSGPR